MKPYFKILTLGILLILPLNADTQQRPAQDRSSCGVLEQSLRDYQRIRVGIHRKELEKYFEQDGGMQFPSATRYIYPNCRYLHVDVKFEAGGNTDRSFSPEDTVSEISKLYVEYPTKD